LYLACHYWVGSPGSVMVLSEYMMAWQGEGVIMISTIAFDLPVIINTSLGIIQSHYKYLFIIKHIVNDERKKNPTEIRVFG